MTKHRIWALIILFAAAALGFFVYSTQQSDDRFSLKYGLDLTGGVHLLYRADTSDIKDSEVSEAMTALRDIMERRVNLFGVSEPIVQTERGFTDNENRLIVELPGVTDTDAAIRRIGETPTLEFRLAKEGAVGTSTSELYEPTGLTGAFLQRARVAFEGGGGGIAEPAVLLEFNSEGKERFAEITRNNIGEVLAIFLDGEPISTPVIRSEIPDGNAIISGNFVPEEARELARELNFGAIPVPIELLSTQTIGPTLGAEALSAGIKAGIIGLSLVALFMIVWYRLPGVVAVLSLAVYILIMLSIFKLVPVVLTAAGIAGFIISIGMAVDANVLIFERLKEERKTGREGGFAVRSAFKRAWLAIRDGNLTSILTAIVLFYAGTFLTQSFALTFGLGVLMSMLTAVTITRTFLLALTSQKNSPNSPKA